MQKKGISLIVLVITIIVMIILAAAIIISLNNTGIIENANKAVSDTDLKQAQEIAQVAHLEGVHQGLKGEELKTYVTDYLKRSGFENLDKFVITVTDEKVTVMGPSVINVVDGVPIPRGFVASSATGENKKSTGLVIYEGSTKVTDENVEEARRSRNQYVWVPVDSSTFDTTFVRQNFGMSFDLSTTTRRDYWEITPSTTYLSYITQESLDEVTAMYNSVKKYGGFYIARYEAGLDDIRTSDTTLITGTNVKSQMGKYIYSDIKISSYQSENMGGAIEVSRSIYPVTNTDYGVVSTLIYGVQWDVTVKWLLDSGAITSATDSTSYGNYKDNAYSVSDLNAGAQQSTDSGKTYSTALEKTSSEGRLLTTGALKKASTNNIYDMAGNLYEWTMEKFIDFNDYNVGRGAAYLESGSERTIAYRGRLDSHMAVGFFSFRTALYIR